jgi:hypothetical protein
MKDITVLSSRWERKYADLWVGIFFKVDYPYYESDHVGKCIHIWICFIPCFPLHLMLVPSMRLVGSWWTLRTRCDAQAHFNPWERWFYAFKAVWCLWMRPGRRSGAEDDVIAAVWDVYAGGDYHAWKEVVVGSDVFRGWWARVGYESE